MMKAWLGALAPGAWHLALIGAAAGLSLGLLFPPAGWHLQHQLYALSALALLGMVSGTRSRASDPLGQKEASPPQVRAWTPLGRVAFLELEFLDGKALITWVGPGSEEVFGYLPEELLGEPLELLYPPRLATEAAALAAAAQQGPVAREVTLTRESGEWFPAWVALSPVRGEDGQVRVAGCVIHDVSILGAAHQQLVERYQFLEDVVASIQDGVNVLDQDMNIRMVNPIIEQWYPHAMPLVGRKCYQAFHGRTSPCEICPTREALETGQMEMKVVPRIGEGGNITGWLELYAVPLRDGGTGEMRGVIEYSRDITGRKQAQDALRESERRYRLLAENVSDVIWTTDLEGRYTYVSPSVFAQRGFRPEEMVGTKATDFVVPASRSTVLEALADITSGEQRERVYALELVRKDGSTLWAETRTNPLCDEAGNIIGVAGITRDISDRKKVEQELRQALAQARSTLDATVTALAAALEKRDPHTAGHEQRVTRLACAIAREMGLDPARMEAIRVAATLHDVGKIYVPAEILSKPGKLLDLEMAIVKRHPAVGYQILENVPFGQPVARIVLQHHERMDGSGYPHGLAGEQILLEARILAVADVVEAMASHRPYRPSKGVATALQELRQNRGVLYDPAVVDACLRLFTEQGYDLDGEPASDQGAEPSA